MKTILATSTLLAMLVAACGGQPEAGTASSPLDVLPETSLLTIAIIDPAEMISSLDGYAAGIPVLGESAVSGWVLAALDCADMSEVESRLGIRTDGALAVYMESMMPQSIGAALTVSDPDTFWGNIGMTPQEAEPLNGYEVRAVPVDFGSIYFCSTNGLILAAGSRAGLQGMLERLDGRIPDGLPEIPGGSFYMFSSIETFGPMFAGQLAMVESQLLAQMSADSEMNMEMMQGILGLYFDAIGLVLTNTRTWNCVLTLGPEYISGSSQLEFVPGSDLDRFVVPAEIGDLAGMVPAGDVMAARVSIDPVTSSTAMNAVFSAMGFTQIPQEMVEFWSLTAKNTAMSMMYDSDNPLHIVAVYEMPDGASLEDVGAAYDAQFRMMGELMTMPGITLNQVESREFGGRQWMTFGMSMDMSEFQPDGAEMETPMSGNISWNAWFTVDEGILYLEMAPEPLTVSAILDGTYQGPRLSDMPEMSGFSDSAEMAMLMNIPGYLNMAMAMSGLDVPPIDAEPVWMEIEMDIYQGGFTSRFRVSGIDMTVFAGEMIQSFAAMAQ